RNLTSDKARRSHGQINYWSNRWFCNDDSSSDSRVQYPLCRDGHELVVQASFISSVHALDVSAIYNHWHCRGNCRPRLCNYRQGRSSFARSSNCVPGVWLGSCGVEDEFAPAEQRGVTPGRCISVGSIYEGVAANVGYVSRAIS